MTEIPPRRVVLIAKVLSRSLRRVVKERERAQDGFPPDAVHDLRVALRRVRSLAEDFSELDSDPEWRRLRKACKQLQERMAGLRDIQVISDLAERLGLPDAGGTALGDLLEQEERRARRKARGALNEFRKKRWKRWRQHLRARTASLPFGDTQFAVLARRRLDDVDRLERRRRRGPSGVAYHRVRVALRRYRYTVEALLPDTPGTGGRGLIQLQRVLGEIHDLDVLRAKIQQLGRRKMLPEETCKARIASVDKARHARAVDYEQLSGRHGKSATGAHGRRQHTWDVWRKTLEQIVSVSVRDFEEALSSKPRSASRTLARQNPDPGKPRPLS